MATARYAVTQPFSISYEKNGTKQSIDVAPGDIMSYDGVNFSIGETAGVSTSLRVVIKEGEWVERLDDGVDEVPEENLKAKPTVNPTRTYNATGGQQIEMSDPAEDKSLYQGRRTAPATPDDLNSIVQQYEQGTEKNGTTMITDDMSDIKREVKVEIPDVREVAQVRASARNAAQTSSGAVTLRNDKPEPKRQVVQGTRMAKQTAPDQTPQTYKHIKVDSQAAGVEVARVSDRSDHTMMKRAAEGDKRQVVQHQTEVKRVSQGTPKRTDVGSSTQAAVERQRDVAPEVTVVSTVRDEATVVSRDGIKSTMTVRPTDEISVGEVTSTSADGGVELSDNDLDVSDILKDA